MTGGHQHEFSLVYWQGRRAHIHRYSTPTTVNQGHRHVVMGNTSAAIGEMAAHVHYYEGETTFEDGHVHHFSGWTGDAIFLPDGSHYHEFSGETSFDDGHTHYYRGRTSKNYSI